MTKVRSGEVSFDVPEGWVDKSVVVYEAPHVPGKASSPNVVVTRQPMPAGRTLDAFVHQQVAELSVSLHEFRLLERRDVMIAGLAAVRLSFQWESPDGPLTQRVTMIEHRGVLFTLAGTAANADAEAIRSSFDAIVATVSIQPSAGAGGRP